ncbi:MAG: quinone-dependent dihydroorotate dehydrogenase [Wenzhouxiangellaceae bacterium]
MYAWLRHGLFALPPELAHDLTLTALRLGAPVGLPGLFAPDAVSDPVRLMGLEFGNRVGLAAGLDKNGDCIDGLGRLGFGFLEVGTVTPRPQPGNPKPRLFRLPEAQAIINRMGFNNRGVDHLVERLKCRRHRGVVGANVGKQKDTPNERAIDDYRYGLERLYPWCDYLTINISSPNTRNLRHLQDAGPLAELLSELVSCGQRLAREHGSVRPLLVKIAPDWKEADLRKSLEVIGASGIDGLIATNTTVSRAGVSGLPHADEPGGLSGAPLLRRANRVLKIARETLGPGFPIIGCGGIMRPADALAKLRAGADLVQVYTGFVYHGPELIRACALALAGQSRP